MTNLSLAHFAIGIVYPISFVCHNISNWGIIIGYLQELTTIDNCTSCTIVMCPSFSFRMFHLYRFMFASMFVGLYVYIYIYIYICVWHLSKKDSKIPIYLALTRAIHKHTHTHICKLIIALALTAGRKLLHTGWLSFFALPSLLTHRLTLFWVISQIKLFRSDQMYSCWSTTSSIDIYWYMYNYIYDLFILLSYWLTPSFLISFEHVVQSMEH